MNLYFEKKEYKIKELKRKIEFYRKELKRIKKVNMQMPIYKTDKNFKYLTDKYFKEYSEMIEICNNRLKEFV